MVLAMVSLVIAYLAAVGTHSQIPHIGEIWQWAVGLWIVFLFFVIAPFRLWSETTEKLEAYEEAERPKLSVSDPIELVEPKGAAGKNVTAREWRLRISNNSTSVMKNCFVKKTSLVNVHGHESDSIGIRFKLNTDQPHFIQSYEHKQSFDLSPGSDELVCICGTNVNVDKDHQTVIMLYAIQGVGGQGIRNAIPKHFFPHILRIQICADNLVHPIEKKYRLFFDSENAFKMEHIRD